MNPIPESDPELKQYYEEVRLVLDRHPYRRQFVTQGVGNRRLKDSLPDVLSFTRNEQELPDGRRVAYAQDSAGRRIYSQSIQNVDVELMTLTRMARLREKTGVMLRRYRDARGIKESEYIVRSETVQRDENEGPWMETEFVPTHSGIEKALVIQVWDNSDRFNVIETQVTQRQEGQEDTDQGLG